MRTTEEKTIIERVKDRINSLQDDLKAEVIISELLDKLDSEESSFLIDMKGQFKRPFRKDVLNAEIIDFKYDDTQFVKVNLSRDGIYDTLPERMFHEPQSGKPKIEVSEMTQEYKSNRNEEIYARKFFQPFENEFFLKALERENLEKEILLELNGSKPIEFFYEFWELNNEIPQILMTKLIRILPYTYKIVGDLELTVNCLSYLLEEKVKISEKTYKEQSSPEKEQSLGNCRLGLDMISGNEYMDYSLYLEFKIGPLKKTSFLEYIHQGKIKKFIELFYEYFLPMEIDVKTTILLNQDIEAFSLKELSILGITTRI
ncbi:type VI secretion system baseplate subunit TssG [Apibacter adventoris]|uniref:type VI secretion system baseplate subunit TssG n=1 Tax=Apibacter adventoris TaxID=1679466 RepID=UPI000CF64CEC|nr:type VI secretion system baseplate subunit TssG [Apibacter adventoris]PQL94153.1 hypothetical protein C4S76_06275 [Apibacter adventoris]